MGKHHCLYSTNHRLGARGLLRAAVIAGCAVSACATGGGGGQDINLPESQCPRVEYHDFSVGTISTYCEPVPGKIVVYEHTYPHGFAIFNPNGDNLVDRYCNRHRCIERSNLRTMPSDQRNTEEQFFDTWDQVLKTLPDAIKNDR